MRTNEFDHLKASYLDRLRRELRRAPAFIREDAVREVQAHIDDGVRERGGDLAALRAVLEHLGPPEEFGRELGLQLMLQAGRRSSPAMLLSAALFWAATSVVGAWMAVGSLILYLIGLAFIADGALRLLSWPVSIIRANGVKYPPDWWPLINISVGGLLIGVLSSLLVFVVGSWGRSNLGQRGLAATLDREAVTLPSGWERHAALWIGLTALLGLFSCTAFGALGGLFPIGRYGSMQLPQDFFKNPLTFGAFLGGLVFLLSPMLGMLWAAWRAQSKADGRHTPTP